MGVVDKVTELAEPVITSHGATIYDIAMVKNKLQIAVTRPGGVDLDTIADITRAISRLLDDADPISAGYTLEVSSPGLERTLRTPGHYEQAIGELVSVKTKPNVEGDRRVRGELVHADADACRVLIDEGDAAGTERTFGYHEIDRARTVFEWGPTPKPNEKQKSKKSGNKSGSSAKSAKQSGNKSGSAAKSGKQSGTTSGSSAKSDTSGPADAATPSGTDAGKTTSESRSKSEVRSS